MQTHHSGRSTGLLISLVFAATLAGLPACRKSAPAEAPPAAGRQPEAPAVEGTNDDGEPTATPAESARQPNLQPNVEPQPALEPESSNPARAPKRTVDRPTLQPSFVQRVGPYAIVPLPLRGFENLSVRERVTAYHLYQASAASRDVLYDQLHRYGLPLRRSLDQVLRHARAIPADLRTRLATYAAALWIGSGPYDPITGKRFSVGFDAAEWSAALDAAARSGATIPDDARDKSLSDYLFNPSMEPTLRPVTGESPVNFYDAVLEEQLAQFEPRYAVNSRLVAAGDELVEQVYRAGRAPAPSVRPAPAGRLASTFETIIGHLEAARKTATPGQARMLEPLIDYLRTGAADDYERYAIAWLADRPRIDLVMGFIETDRDPRGEKGAWESLLTLVDGPSLALLRAVADEVPEFERRAPWADEYRRTYQQDITTPMARQVVVAHGDAGPVLPLGRSLPNLDGVRREHGARTIVYSNVLRALESAVGGPLIDEFAPAAQRAAAHRWAPLLREATFALTEVYGRDCGKLRDEFIGTDDAVRLREWTAPLEQLRLDLVVLHTLFEPGMADALPECTEACRLAALQSYVRDGLANLRFAGPAGFKDDRRRAAHVLLHRASAASATKLITEEGKRYQVVSDAAGFRKVVKELLAEVTRIRGEGDYEAARKLFVEVGGIDAGLRNEVTLRAARLELPQRIAWLFPELVATRRPDGSIADVQVQAGESFEAQHLGWASP